MFLLIVIIILIAATSILGNIYVGIFPFLQNYGDLENYSNSQYAAISSIERGLLVSKYKHPSFVGSGGFLGTGSWGEKSDLFSGTFGKYNQEKNGTYRNIDSQCDSEKGILRNNDVLVFNTYNYDTTPTYTGDNETTSDSISTTSELNGTLSMPINNVNLIKGNVYRQIEGDDTLKSYTGFVAGSGSTLITYNNINNKNNININKDTKNPTTWASGDVLCTQDGCYENQTISDLIGSNDDKGIIFYIKDRMIDLANNGSIGGAKYNITNDWEGNCQNYNILGTAIIGKYKQEINIQKPSFNYKNPNRKKFIFPYYN